MDPSSRIQRQVTAWLSGGARFASPEVSVTAIPTAAPISSVVTTGPHAASADARAGPTAGEPDGLAAGDAGADDGGAEGDWPTAGPTDARVSRMASGMMEMWRTRFLPELVIDGMGHPAVTDRTMPEWRTSRLSSRGHPSVKHPAREDRQAPVVTYARVASGSTVL